MTLVFLRIFVITIFSKVVAYPKLLTKTVCVYQCNIFPTEHNSCEEELFVTYFAN